MMEAVDTREVIELYMMSYLKQKALEFKGKYKPASEYVNEDHTPSIEKALFHISEDLRDFISEAHNEQFEQMMESINDNNLDYDDFKTLADELFSEGISWIKIVTFLVFGGELASKALINGQDEKFVHNHIIDSLSKYVDENLLQWIREQENGWMNVCSFAQASKSQNFSNNSHKSMRQYFRMATCAAFIGGLYLCSKLVLQK